MRTPGRNAVRSMRREGKSHARIGNMTGLSRCSIQYIFRISSSKRSREGKATQQELVSDADINRVLDCVSGKLA